MGNVYLRRALRVGVSGLVAVHVLLQTAILFKTKTLGLSVYLDFAVVLLLALIWYSTGLRYLSDSSTHQKRLVFYAFTLVNARQYLDLLRTGGGTVELLADVMSLAVVFLMLKSQARTVLLSRRQQRNVDKVFVVSSALMVLLHFAGKWTGNVSLEYMYVVVFTGSHLVIVWLLFYWYFQASRTSLSPMVGWRFRFLCLAATAYFAMFVFHMFATLVGGYEFPGWDVIYLSIKTGLIVVGLSSIHLAFNMGSRLSERLLHISSRWWSRDLYDELIVLAARLCDTIAREPGNLLSTYAVRTAEIYGGLDRLQMEVLSLAANTAYVIWNKELPSLRTVGPTSGNEVWSGFGSSQAVYDGQLYELRAVSRIIQTIERPYELMGDDKPVEARILHVVLDYLRTEDWRAVERHKGSLYEPQAVEALKHWIEQAEGLE